MNRAVIDCRVSTKDQVENFSLATQEKACRQFCSSHAFDVDKIFIEEDESAKTAKGNDMDTYAADVAELVKSLDLKNAIHIGPSTGGGELTRYVAKHGKGRVVKAGFISAIPPLFMKTDKNPDGVPKEVVDGIRAGTANHRSQFYIDIRMPFCGFNRPGAVVSEGIRRNWWQ